MKTGRARTAAGDVSSLGSIARRAALVAVLASQSLPALLQQAIAQSAAAPNASAPLPRFVSLKSDRVNMRSGPAGDTPILWVYRRAGLPVEILKEGADGWRQVRDAEGATGWVVQTMLSNRRTALVLPWEVKPGAALPLVSFRAEQNDRAPAVAEVEAGVIANVVTCSDGWCRVAVGDTKGYVEQKKLWGVYPGETIK